ncbi:multidrug ABC transporter permease [Leuconostoc miyukkimchii]|uniref:multidrug ABC transporter permease n=1 Tax=Leuconostoc miyukkimchii TaxID=910540 RepID=UPI001C7D3858|nr:multidrug ABC transporter permease [Leuconostoc miyukkimchii]
MKDFFDVVWFHLKLFAKNSYFRTIVFVTTISYVLIQYVAAYAVQDLGNKTIWLRAGIIGTWAAGTSAAGVIPFQRAQGTLAYILDSRRGEAFSLSTLIIPAACFGLLSFPISFITSYVLGIDVSSSNWFLLILGIFSLWFSVIILDFVVAGIFVLTPNAMLYEGLLMAPILIGSGIYSMPGKWDTIVKILGLLLPMTTPVKLILNPNTITYVDLAQMLVCSIIWLIVAKALLTFCLKKVRISGDMEAI